MKAFPVSSLSRARRARMTKWNLKSRDRLLVGPDVDDRSGAGQCVRSIERSRVASLTNSRLDSHRDASASCCAFAHAHVQSGPTMGRLRDLRSHFVIRARHARFFLVDFLVDERRTDRKDFNNATHQPKS